MKLKKLLPILFCIALMLTTLCLPAFAASDVNANEQAVYDKLFNGTEVAGKIICPVDEMQGVVFNYLIRDEVDMTADQRDRILAYIDDCYALKTEANVIEWVKSGDTDLSHLTRPQKERLLANGKAAAAVMGLTFDYNTADNTVTITNHETVLCYTEAVVKQTGSSSPYILVCIAVALAVVFAATVTVTLKVRRKA